MKLFCPLSIALSCAAVAWPQAVVENATVTAASSTSTAVAGATGKSIGGVFDSLSKRLDRVGKSGTSVPVSKPAATVPTASGQVTTQPAAPTAAKLVDPTQEMIGLDVEELIRRCGEPSMSISQVRGSDELVETYWYYGSHHDVFEVTLRDGAVSSVAIKVPQAREKNSVVFR